MGPEILLARPDVLIFAGVCLVIFLCIGFSSRRAHDTWMKTVVDLVEENSGIAEVSPVLQSEYNDLKTTSGNLNSLKLFEAVAEQHARMSGQSFKPKLSRFFQFKIAAGPGRELSFWYDPHSREMLDKTIYWRGGRIRLSWDNKKMLRDAADQALVMWKMTQNL